MSDQSHVTKLSDQRYVYVGPPRCRTSEFCRTKACRTNDMSDYRDVGAMNLFYRTNEVTDHRGFGQVTCIRRK